VIAEPPSDAGAVHETVTEPLSATPLGVPGAPGTVNAFGVTGTEGCEAGPVPTLFVAVTVKVYAVPLVSAVTVQESAPVVEHILPPAEAVAV
jgi:hypothetical protein